MGHYPFTPFNIVSAILLVLTLGMIWLRVRGFPAAVWPMIYYAGAAAYALGFSGGLQLWWVIAGAACAVAFRITRYRGVLRFVELAPLGYIAFRLLGLILMW